MPPLQPSDAAGQPPVAPVIAGVQYWRQLSLFEKRWVLQIHHVPVATLRLQTSGAPQAVIETIAGTWHIARHGAARHEVTVSHPDGSSVASAAVGLGGQANIVVGDRHYHWQPDNFWRSHWALQDGHDNTLVDVESVTSLMRRESKVTVSDDGAGCPDIALLVPLCWYLFLKEKGDRETRQA